MRPRVTYDESELGPAEFLGLCMNFALHFFHAFACGFQYGPSLVASKSQSVQLSSTVGVGVPSWRGLWQAESEQLEEI